MSYETWCEEFYPVSADYCKEEDAIEHSLRKWIGLRIENLDKHELRIVGRSVRDGNSHTLLIIADRSCSLCRWYASFRCDDCPLAQVLGGRCDVIDAPYDIWCDTKNPEPMIEALQKAKELKDA